MKETRKKTDDFKFLKKISIFAYFLCFLFLTSMMAQNTHATAILYTDRSIFDAANPGLPVEDFEGSFLPSGPTFPLTFPDDWVGVFPGPLNSSTSNAVYAAGSILDGISMRAIPNSSIAVVVPTAFGVSSTVAGPNFFSDSVEFDFSSSLGGGVSAVGLDMIAPFGTTTVNFEIFGQPSFTNPTGLIGNGSVTAGLAGGFFGVSSDTYLITRILGTETSPIGDLYDNIAFGEPIPEPATVALLGIGILGLAGAEVRRRRKKKPEQKS